MLQELVSRRQTTTQRNNEYVPLAPSDKQREFLAVAAPEALFGGAAGGGKSVALLMSALGDADDPYRFVGIASYRALLLRRTYTDLILPDALMDIANRWFRGTSARWLAAERAWLFPSGAKIVFGHLDNENDKFRYQSSAWHYVAFDELTQFTETQYRYLFSRLRTRDADIPLRMRAASNPGGVGHDWVRARFVYSRDDTRVFIPSLLAENPGLDHESYRAMLARLDPITRRQLEDGDWEALQLGALFRRADFQAQEIVPDLTATVRYWDLAATPKTADVDSDFTAGVLMGRTDDNRFVILDIQHERLSPDGVLALMRQTAALDRARHPAYRVVFEEEGGSSGKFAAAQIIRELAGFDVCGRRVTGDKTTRAKPLAAQVAAGNVSVVPAGWTEAFLREASAFPYCGHDDQIDAASGAFAELAVSKTLSCW